MQNLGNDIFSQCFESFETFLFLELNGIKLKFYTHSDEANVRKRMFGLNHYTTQIHTLKKNVNRINRECESGK